MKKYKVKTDNLDWYCVKKGDVLHCPEKSSMFSQQIEDIINKHPDWLEEIQEKEYTEDDLIKLLEFYEGDNNWFNTIKITIKQWKESRK